MLAADQNIRFFALFSQGTVLHYFNNFDALQFVRQILLHGFFMECELLQSPMISY